MTDAEGVRRRVLPGDQSADRPRLAGRAERHTYVVVRAPETLRAEGRSQYRERIRLQRSLSSQYDISLDLLRSHEEDPQRLGWLRRTSARAGCLGLWTETPPPATSR
jgi:predicted Zn-dependent protease